MMASEEISLRPLSLRPGAGVNPFAQFAQGAGIGLKNKQTATGGAAEEKRKPRGEVIKYSSEFLMKFAEKYTRIPTELQFGNLEIVVDPSDPDRDAQRKLVQKVVGEDADDRDWRSRSSPAQGDGKTQNKQKEDSSSDPNAPKIQRASDLGRTAWAAGEDASGGTQQVMRKVKGILNKLTPEKFERLLGQLIPLITSHEILQGTIKLVFENAVAQPTFVAMYANLCAELDSILPEFTGSDGKPESFRKMLANTCQEEYEATESARSAAVSSTSIDKEESQARAKNRLLGNVRLIAELFKKEMVNDRIMVLILSDLLGPAENNPSEDSLEAACELVTVAGAALESSPRSKARLDLIFKHFTRLSNTTSYAPRIRFVVKDVVDLRAQNWVARRETFTAKKLDEIRTEAQVELGIVDVDIPGLTPLIPGVQSLPGAKKGQEDVELFPAFRGAMPSTASGEGQKDGKFSSLLGDFTPITEQSSQPKAETREPRKDLSEEDRVSLGKSLYTDFISSNDVAEAVASAQELVIPGFGKTLVEIGINRAYDSPNVSEQLKICDVIVELVGSGVVTAEEAMSAVKRQTENLEDTVLDVPAAPKVLGRIIGVSVVKGVSEISALDEQAQSVEGAEPRRGLVAATLQAVKENLGEEKMVAIVKGSNMDLRALLDRDPEIESYLPDLEEFAASAGLQAAL